MGAGTFPAAIRVIGALQLAYLTFKCSLPRHDCGQRENAIPQVAQTKVLVVGVLVIVEVRERNAYDRHVKSVNERGRGNASPESANAHQPFTPTGPQSIGYE